MGMDGAAIPMQLRVGFAAAGVTLPVAGVGVSVALGALSAWHSGSADFSPGDSEVIAGLWRAPPARPLSGVFC